jgi:exonuclease SbcD
LNDRLGRISRQPHLVARLQEIAAYLNEHEVDVMVVAGDLFSQHSRPDEMRQAVEDVNGIFKPFLMRGGTILAISGNHDSEALFDLLRCAMDLAAPLDPSRAGPRPRGRLYLAAQPTYLLLEDRAGQKVQFALLPYPTSARYLRDEGTRYNSLDEKNRLLHQALLAKLGQIEQQKIDPRLPSVLVGHIHVRGSQTHNLYHISEREDVIFEVGDIPFHWAYVAYGHIHRPQELPGASHVRYSGSIECLDYAEKDDAKTVILAEIGPKGLIGEAEPLPLHSTPIFHVDILEPDKDMAGLADRYPAADQALVSYRLVYKPGQHDRDQLCRELESVFPNWYRREIVAEGAELHLPGAAPTGAVRDVPGTVRSYLQQHLAGQADETDLLALADQLLAGLEVSE